jgi:hypothetical protein
VGDNSFAVGNTCQAIGSSSVSAGLNSVANGNYSIAMGNECKTAVKGEFACGNYNVASGQTHALPGQMFSVGYGSKAHGNNLFTVGNNGIQGVIGMQGKHGHHYELTPALVDKGGQVVWTSKMVPGS